MEGLNGLFCQELLALLFSVSFSLLNISAATAIARKKIPRNIFMLSGNRHGNVLQISDGSLRELLRNMDLEEGRRVIILTGIRSEAWGGGWKCNLRLKSPKWLSQQGMTMFLKMLRVALGFTNYIFCSSTLL